MKRIAVLIVGEFRTWPHCALNLFSLFHNRAEQVDYFFVTWSSTMDLPELQITPDLIFEKFKLYEKNLVAYNIVATIGRKVSTFYNQAYLAKVANILKREYELRNNFIYDQVIETRPDVYMRPRRGEWHLMKDYEVCNCGHIGKSTQGFDEIDDVYYRSNSFTNDILANRYWYRKPADHYTNIGGDIQIWHNHHCMIVEYFKMNGIKFDTKVIDFFSPPIAVRQDAIHIDFNDGNLEELKAKYQPFKSDPTVTLLPGPTNWH